MGYAERGASTEQAKASHAPHLSLRTPARRIAGLQPSAPTLFIGVRMQNCDVIAALQFLLSLHKRGARRFFVDKEFSGVERYIGLS